MVDDAFELTDLGLTFTPNVEVEIAPGEYHARAIKPNGDQAVISVTPEWVHFSPGGYKLVCRAPGSTRDDVPSGTSLWLR